MNFTEYDGLNLHKAPQCSYLAFHQMQIQQRYGLRDIRLKLLANLRLNSLCFRGIRVANLTNRGGNGNARASWLWCTPSAAQ